MGGEGEVVTHTTFTVVSYHHHHHIFVFGCGVLVCGGPEIESLWVIMLMKVSGKVVS